MNTAWERLPVSAETRRYLRNDYAIWSRLADGEHIFTVVADGRRPGENDGGYASIAAALRIKGLM